MLLFLILVWTCFTFLTHRRAAHKLAPGPYPFPIIGNLLQLRGEDGPHRTLAKLSKTYGPLMSLRLGRKYTVIVSSPRMAKEILLKNDQAFASRPIPAAAEVHDHHKFSMVFLPAGNVWRKLRKLSKEKMFSAACMEASEGLRREKSSKLCEYVQRCCEAGRAVNIGEAGFITALNLMSATLFSTEVVNYDPSDDSAREFMNDFQSLMDIAATPDLADLFPVLKPFDLQGIHGKAQFYLGKLLAFIENLINQRISMQQQSKGSEKKTDMLQTLLDLHSQGGSEYEFLSVKAIKHLLADLFIGGSDAVSSTVEWAMTELLLNPEIMSKVKHEIRTIIGENKHAQESDISRLPYFQAVIKETFRFHPLVPLLVPHKAESDVQISNGCKVPEGTQVLINVWAMGRDPSVWLDPDSFVPERFLDNSIDFRGQHFELIPFGSGRRICPGLPLGNRMIHIMLATLIHNFDWKLEAGAEAEAARKEELGAVLHRASPLMTIPLRPLSYPATS